jgi:hypothetical protein
MFDHTYQVAKHCIEICERNGHWESARLIRERYFITKTQTECVLLKPKDIHEDSPH